MRTPLCDLLGIYWSTEALQSAGLMRDVRSAAEIIRGMVEQSEAVLREAAAGTGR